jgi:hypothetical protein
MKTKFKDYADFSHSALQIISMLGGKAQIKKTEKRGILRGHLHSHVCRKLHSIPSTIGKIATG